MSNQYEVLLTFRKDISPDDCIPIDNEDILNGLMCVVKEVCLVRYDRYLALMFAKDEIVPTGHLTTFTNSEAGEGDEPMLPFGAMVKNRRKWKSWLTMFKPRRNNR